MRTRLFLLFFSSICAVTAVYANMRQRWQVDRYPSYFPQSVPGASVDSEDLNFICDLAYEGDADWSEMQKRGCNVRALYAITTKTERGVALEFILPSEDPVTVFINGEKVKVDSREIVMTDTTRRAYRLSEVCHFCGSKFSRLYAASFDGKLRAGTNKIEVHYRQPYSFYETAYGYFKTSEWLNSFEYELWPLRSWEVSPGFKMNIRVQLQRPGWLKRITTDSKLECSGENLQIPTHFKLPPQSTSENNFESWIKQNTRTDVKLNRRNEADQAIFTTTMTENFPDRLSCIVQSD